MMRSRVSDLSPLLGQQAVVPVGVPGDSGSAAADRRESPRGAATLGAAERQRRGLFGHHLEAASFTQQHLEHLTSFFRDPDTFDVREGARCLPAALARPPRSTRLGARLLDGEEAHSMAISRHECVQRVIDSKAIDLRARRYPLDISAYVSAERLERFFVHEDNTYRSNKQRALWAAVGPRATRPGARRPRPWLALSVPIVQVGQVEEVPSGGRLERGERRNARAAQSSSRAPHVLRGGG